MFAANRAKTSCWVTASPASTPASMSVTSAIGRQAHPQLARQGGLRCTGHVDQRPAAGGVVARLGAGGEPRAVDDHHRPASPYALRPRQRGAEARAVRVGEGEMYCSPLDEGAVAAGGAVDQLVGHDEVAGRHLVAQTADGAGRQHLTDAQ